MSDACDFLILDAPFPPSQNAKDQPVKLPRKGGGMRCSIGQSAEYKSYLARTFTPWWYKVRQKGRLQLGDSVMLWTVTCPPRAGCDTDNYHKVFLDCLEELGAFPNDNVVISTHNERGPRIRGGWLRVYLANERRRDALQEMYFEEYRTLWLPQRDGPIIDPPRSQEITRLQDPDHSEEILPA